jgi:hypothetical protein
MGEVEEGSVHKNSPYQFLYRMLCYPRTEG